MSNQNDDLFKNLQDGISDFGKRVGSFVDDVLNSENLSNAFSDDLRVPHDAYQEGDEFIVEIELPGMQKEAIQVQIHEDELIVKGEKQPTPTERPGEVQKRERQYGSFLKTVVLPDDVEKEKSKAAYKMGVLTIRFPRPQATPPAPETEDDGTSVEIN
ncbi:MAG: Hsp20/alpha crystallin family protein [Bacteroidota bacterium]